MTPRYHCQHPLNSGQYAQMIYRLYLRSGDQDLLAHFYDSAKRAIRYQFSLDDDDDGLVNDQAHVSPGELWPANQFYDIWPWWGTSAYVAGTWLATLSCGAAMATAMNDSDFAAECADWLARGKAAYQDKLWNGEHYRLWHDPANTSGEGPDCDVSLGNQLMAQWCVRIAGAPDILPAEQVQSALGAVKRLNMARDRAWSRQRRQSRWHALYLETGVGCRPVCRNPAQQRSCDAGLRRRESLRRDELHLSRSARNRAGDRPADLRGGRADIAHALETALSD